MKKKIKPTEGNKLFFTRAGFGVKKISLQTIKRNLKVIKEIVREGERQRNGSSHGQKLHSSKK